MHLQFVIVYFMTTSFYTYSLPISTTAVSVYETIKLSSGDPSFKCPYLRQTKLLEPEPDYLTKCTNFSAAQSLARLTLSNTDEALCLLYYNNFEQLCYISNNYSEAGSVLNNNVIDAILKLYENKLEMVCETLKNNPYFVDNSKPGIEVIRKSLEEGKCIHMCTDFDLNVKPICSIITFMINVTRQLYNQSSNLIAQNSVSGVLNSEREVTSKSKPHITETYRAALDKQASNQLGLDEKQSVPAIQQSVEGQSHRSFFPIGAAAAPGEVPAAQNIETPKKDLTSTSTAKAPQTNVNSASENQLYNGYAEEKELEDESELYKTTPLPVNDKQKSIEPVHHEKTGEIEKSESKLPTGSQVNNNEDNEKDNTVGDNKLVSQEKKCADVVEEKVNQNPLPFQNKSTKSTKNDKEVPLVLDGNQQKDQNIKKVPEDKMEEDTKLSSKVDAVVEVAGESPQDFKDEFQDDADDDIDGAGMGNEGDIEYNNNNEAQPKYSEVKTKPLEKSKPLEIDEDGSSFSANYQNQSIDDSDSYFFSYFMMVCIMFICGYVAYHNKQKILALVVEGRKNRRPSRTRRPNSANYRKLDSNLEEAVTSSCNKNATQVIY